VGMVPKLELLKLAHRARQCAPNDCAERMGERERNPLSLSLSLQLGLLR